MSKSPLLALALLATACSSSPDQTVTGDDANVTKDSGMHDVFVCNGSDKSVGNGVFMFAHDEKGQITNATKEGYCPLTTDAQGHAYGTYFCWVGNTTEAKTTDGQLALLFQDNLGDGAYLYHQLDLPRDLLEKKQGSGKLRILSRAPKDLTAPIATGSDVQTIDCAQQKVKFEQPK